MNILVIKLGALGDVVLAFQPFADIRAHHPNARITLLTTKPFAALLQRAPWFDAVRIDTRPPWWNLRGLLALRRQLRGFDLVYDLQTSGRSSRYHRLAGRPPWSGIARGATHPHDNPARNAMHTIDRQRDQLAQAGVPPGPTANLDWLVPPSPLPAKEGPGLGRPGQTDTMHEIALTIAGTRTSVPHPYAILIPGAAPHRPAKRWPPEHFATLAGILQGRGLTPVIAGTATETPLATIIRKTCPTAIDLTGRTTLPELATLAAHATLSIGNDTGPMHLAAAVGCPGIVLFGPESDPALTAPRGRMTILHAQNLPDLAPERVAAALPTAHTLPPQSPHSPSQAEPQPCPP